MTGIGTKVEDIVEMNIDLQHPDIRQLRTDTPVPVETSAVAHQRTGIENGNEIVNGTGIVLEQKIIAGEGKPEVEAGKGNENGLGIVPVTDVVRNLNVSGKTTDHHQRNGTFFWRTIESITANHRRI